MAKVTQEYYEAKRAAIVDAALEVCKRKTVSSVTMQDIINETGFSQGAIYRYYKNIDQILTDLLSRIVTEQHGTFERLNSVLSRRLEEIRSARSAPLTEESRELRRRVLVETIKELHGVWAETLDRFLYPHLKIQTEFTILADNYPERARVIFPNAVQEDTVDDTIVEELRREIEDGTITPRIPLSEFMEFNAVVYSGMIKRAIMLSCYQRNAFKNDEFVYDFGSRFSTFARTSCYFLGLEGYWDDDVPKD